MPHILLHRREEVLTSSQSSWRYFLPSGSYLLLLFLQKPCERVSQHCPMHRPGKPGEVAGPDAWEGSNPAVREESWLGRIPVQLSSPGNSPMAASPSCQPPSSLSTCPQPTGCAGGKKRGMWEIPQSSYTAEEGVMKRVVMLRSGLDHSRNHFCLPRATPAASPARKCNSHIQTRGATPLILLCCTGCTKLLENQLPSAPWTG